MASSIPAPGKSSTLYQWMWNASADPFSQSQPAEWRSFSDVQNIIIERSFQAGQTHAVLDDYHIDLKHKIQISNNDKSQQRPVERRVRNSDSHHLREERFTFTAINPKRPFGDLYGWISPFIREVVKYLKITPNQLPSRDKTTVPMIVEKAALGIIEEGKMVGQQWDAEELANMLMEKKEAGMKEVWKRCAYLYSLESFLYKKLNETMRLIGNEEYKQDWGEKIRTLGPFCLLLWDNPFNCKTTKPGTLLYRGANLTEEQVSSFERDCLKRKELRSFPSFTSCSRNRAKAEPFGNALFIMKVKHAFTMDLKPFSQYPDEEEELLSPGVCFLVDRVERTTGKHLIYLHLVQQHRRAEEQPISSETSDEHHLRVLASADDLLAGDADRDLADAFARGDFNHGLEGTVGGLNSSNGNYYLNRRYDTDDADGLAGLAAASAASRNARNYHLDRNANATLPAIRGAHGRGRSGRGRGLARGLAGLAGLRLAGPSNFSDDDSVYYNGNHYTNGRLTGGGYGGRGDVYHDRRGFEEDWK